MASLMEVNNLRTYFFMHGYTIRAVDGISFSVARGEKLGIVGESGCGKSQTSMSIMRLVPDPPGITIGGRILFDGKDILRLDEAEMRGIRGNRISMIFQEPMTSLNPVFTVGFQIEEALSLHRGMDRKDAAAEAEGLLALVGISDPDQRIGEYPFQLSGGLRQRVMIAMAMACRPDLMIADEPTTALDVTIQAQILRLIRQLSEGGEMGTIFITHDLAVIAGFTERVIVMYAGVIVEDSKVKDIFKTPLHPYTQGLLGSIPVLGRSGSAGGSGGSGGRRRRLSTIGGSLPDPRSYPKGCRFAGRCPRAMPKCHQAEPALVSLGDGRRVRCFLHSDETEERFRIPEHLKDRRSLMRWAGKVAAAGAAAAGG